MTMGSSVQWNARIENGAEFPVRPWMLKFSEASCSYLKHGDWDWETGMNRDQLANFEYVRDYGMLAVYSNWAFLKNLSRRKRTWRIRQQRREWRSRSSIIPDGFFEAVKSF
jgi:hypothetical protein